MFNYSYLNKDCPEEKMEPQKSKKTKISKPLLVDAATLDQMRLRFDQIKQKNALPGQISPPTNILRPVTSNHIALPKTTPRPVPLVNTDVAMEIFPITRDTAIQEFKKALQNKNAAVHMNKVRDAKFVHE
ncbi:AAEL002695-PA [Aedes aegypti]|uniref:AAEL002695-PA n=1 Tax=Aedes aegypti TaxID=7159 RepID=Q17HH0_AEDAE|nr:AAEL002695-PA [Aedes aegypti]